MKRILGLTILTILPLLAGQFTLSISPDDVDWMKLGEYTSIEIEGFSNREVSGGVELPSRSFTYILPQTEKARDVSVISMKTFELGGMNELPGTGENPINSPEEVIPSQPLSVVAAGYQNGASLTTISFCPVIYEPDEKRVLIITEITFEIVTDPAPPAGHPAISWWRDYEEYLELLEGTVKNPLDVITYAPQWETVNKALVTPTGYDDHPHSIPMITSAIIIVPENLVNEEGPFGQDAAAAKAALTDFVEWQRKSGRPVGWCTYEMIYELYTFETHTPQDSVEAIRDFLKASHYSLTSLGYTGIWTAVLVGDGTTTAPCAYLYPSTNPNVDSILSDYYFAANDAVPSEMEDWDLNHNGRLGEKEAGEGDAYFDIYIGRVPANHPQHLINWMEKQLYWERESSIASAYSMATLQYCCGNSSWDALAKNELDDAIPIESDGNPDGYIRLQVNYSCSPDPSGALGHQSAGYGFCGNISPEGSNPSVRTHFMITDADHMSGLYGTGYSASLAQLTNHDKYSVAYPLNPYSCNFNDPVSIAAGYLSLNRNSYGEIDNEVVGSPVCIGATGKADINTGMQKGQRLQWWFFKHIFQVDEHSLLTSPHSTGWGHYKAKENYWDERQECYSYNLFGAPWTCPWLRDKGISAGFKRLDIPDIPPDPLQEGGFYTFHVTDGSSPVSDAILTVYQPQIWESPDTSWHGGVIQSYNSIPPDGYVNVYFNPDDFLNRDTEGGGPVYITAVRYRETIPRESWNSVRPVQYLPSTPEARYLSAYHGLDVSDVEEQPLIPTELSLEVRQISARSQPLLVRFGNPSTQQVNVSLYDASGRQILTRYDEEVAPGWFEFSIDPNKEGLASGPYFVKLTTRNKTLTEKVTVVK